MSHNGFVTSSPLEQSRPAMLTSEASLTCEPTTSAATPNAISSPASEDGQEPCGLQDGPTIVPSGLAPVRVSRFRAWDCAKVMPINDISGPLFTRLSPSADLQSSLESKLRARMDVSGSPEYVLIWRPLDMPAGPQICALRASARRISETAYSGLPTPLAHDRFDLYRKPVSLTRKGAPKTISALLLKRGVSWKLIAPIYCLVMGYPALWNHVRSRVLETLSFHRLLPNSSPPTGNVSHGD